MTSNGMPRHVRDLPDVVKSCLPRLRVISLFLDIYGGAEQASLLQEIVEELQDSIPAGENHKTHSDFLVRGLFRVSRQQIAALLSSAIAEGRENGYTIAGFTAPEALSFTTSTNLGPRLLDCPLNEGGRLLISSGTQCDSQARTLDLAAIATGLDVLATQCPRHFADFLMGHVDGITGEAFLQCCLFGEVVDG